MAIFGAQMVLTLIMASIIQKLGPHYSFAKWILCSTGLYRFLHPTDDELRSKMGLNTRDRGHGGGKGSHRNKHHLTNGRDYAQNQLQNRSFHVPCNIEIDLQTVPVVSADVIHLKYFTEYQWLVDFSVYTAIVYIISEIYNYNFPVKNETNFSMIWCLLAIFFALKLLSSLTVLYFQSDESIGERSMVIVACLVYILIAMIVLIIDESILETGLEEAYRSFNNSATEFLNQQGLRSSGPASKIVVKFFIAVGCGVLGSLFTFPGLRMAKMHWDSLKYCQTSKFRQLLLNISFILPFISVILWIRPISRDYLTVRIFSGMSAPLLKPHIFETLRLLMVIFVVVLRFSLMPIYLQSYLNLASERIVNLRQEAGRITNIDYQKKISSIFYYLCVVTLQFTAPLILCLYLTLMYKNLGGYNWTGLFVEPLSQSASDQHLIKNATETLLKSDLKDQSTNMESSIMDDIDILESAQNLQASFINLKNVFTTEVYKGVLGFATWWSYFTLFATSSLGMVYQSYFSKA